MRTTRLAFLDCDYTVSVAKSKYGPFYSDLFKHHLTAAAKRSSTPLSFSAYNVQQSQYPDPTQIDAILIGGGIAAAYDTSGWVPSLIQYIQHIYAAHPHIKLFGVCLGHQVIAHALLAAHGVKVTPNPAGRQFGIRHVRLSPEYLGLFPKLAGRDLRVQVVHGDHVEVPREVPGWIRMGSTDCCEVHGLCEPGRVLTFQGHFEFDAEVSETTIRHFFTEENGWPREVLEKELQKVQGETDNGDVADLVLGFLRNDVSVSSSGDVEVDVRTGVSAKLEKQVSSEVTVAA